MAKSLLKRVEKVIEEKVRPALGEHSGDIAIVDLKDGVLKVRFLGQCSNCPSANLTLESVVKSEIEAALPEIKDVILVTGVSDELLDLAKSMLRHTDDLRSKHEDRN